MSHIEPLPDEIILYGVLAWLYGMADPLMLPYMVGSRVGEESLENPGRRTGILEESPVV
jgi:hypothetical protein